MKKITNQIKYQATIVKGFAYSHSGPSDDYLEQWREVHNFTKHVLELLDDKLINQLSHKEIEQLKERAQKINKVAYEHANPEEYYFEEWLSVCELAETIIDNLKI